MKKLFSMLLVLLCAALLAPALAEAPQLQYVTSRSLAAELDLNGYAWEYYGVMDGMEQLRLTMTLGGTSRNLDIRLNASGDLAALVVDEVLRFDEADRTAVLRLCNTMNLRYSFTCFYIDDTIDAVVCSMDIILHDDARAGDIVVEGMEIMQAVLQDAYPSLRAYEQ